MKSRSLSWPVLTAALLTSMSLHAAQVGYDELIQESLQARNNGDFEQAEALLLQARPLARDTNEVDFLIGLTQAFQERFLDAMRTLDAALETYPDDVSLKLARARVLSYQGIYGEAIAQTNSILDDDSTNLDARNLRARIYFYQNRYAQARQDYETVLDYEPDNLEAVVGLYDVALAQGDDTGTEQRLLQAQQIAPDHIDVRLREQRLNTPIQRPNRLSLSGARSEFDRAGIALWYDRALDYRYALGSGDEIILHGEHAHRFGTHDTLLEAGYRWARNGSVPIELAVGKTRDSDFLPRQRVRLSAEFDLFDASQTLGATTLGLNLFHATYQNGDVNRVSLDFTHYLLGVNAWLTPGLGLVRDQDGDQNLSWNLGAHWQTGPRLRLGYQYTDAPETENTITTKTQSHHLYGLYQLSDSWALRLDYSESDRENSYVRENLSASLLLRF